MYKATHSYKGEQDHILSFAAGENLCILEKNNESWWLASNNQGKVGYIPKTYVKIAQEDSTDIVLQSVNTAIEEIISSAPNGSFNPKQQALLRKLISHKESIINTTTKHRQESKKRRAPPPPPQPRNSDLPQTSQTTSEVSISKETYPCPPIPDRITSLQNEKKNTTEMNSDSIEKNNLQHNIPYDLGAELLNILQDTLPVSEAKSRETLQTLLQTIKNRVPTLENVMTEILETVPVQNRDEEADKLGLALANLKEIKDDAQQRNWAIRDDEETIAAILNEILTELTTLEKQYSTALLKEEQHNALHTLVDYHQMETRVSLRLLVLQIFGVVCSLSKNLVSALMTTVLPLELSMDIVNHTQDSQRTCYSALVMTMLCSTAEPIPFSHYGQLSKGFVEYMIRYIEDEIQGTEQNEQVMDMFVNVILSFNLHFVDPSENLVMRAISDRGTCTSLSEKIMMLVNRGDDPVAMEEHWVSSNEGRPPPSVLKFLQDIFSQRSTSVFLYTNDMNVLLDIITRNLTDLSSGDKLRTEYLDLLLNILMHTDYSDTRQRASDIGSSLHRILQEDHETTEDTQVLEFDKRIVEKILQNFGHFFS